MRAVGGRMCDQGMRRRLAWRVRRTGRGVKVGGGRSLRRRAERVRRRRRRRRVRRRACRVLAGRVVRGEAVETV